MFFSHNQGFHKVDPDRWEWANEGFVKGQKHLLKTIKRKKKSAQDAPSDLQPAPVKIAPGTENIEIGKYGGLEKEVETLKRDKALLMQQLVDLRQYQQSSSLEVQNLIQRLRVMEQNQQQMMALLAIVVQNPDFLNQLVQQQRRGNWWNDDGSRKRRFRALEQGPVADQEPSGAGAQIIQYNPPIPETPHQVISVNVAQPVSSPESVVPMDAETTNSVDPLASSGDLFTDTSALSDWDDMLLGCEIEDILPAEQDFQMGEQHNGQVEAPLTVDDYTEYTACHIPQLEQEQQLQDCQMEAQQNHKNPQYGIHIVCLFHAATFPSTKHAYVISFIYLSNCHVQHMFGGKGQTMHMM
jgi:heat shock transcription factor